MSRANYRTCHVGDEAVSQYELAYRSGYSAAQWRFLEQPLLEKLFGELRDSGARRMLDIACGQGRITLFGAKYFEHVRGIDYSEDMLSIAGERLRNDTSLSQADVQFQQADVRDFTADAPYHVITAFRFFLNAEDSLRRDGLRCVRRNLAQDGAFITNVHVAGSSPLAMFYRLSNAARQALGRAPDPVRNSISLSAFRRLLSSEGFEITNVFRYSLMPRIGSLTDSLVERHLGKIERLGTAVPGMKYLCQSFLVCARMK